MIALSALKLIQKLIISVVDNLLFMLRIATLLLNILNGCGLLLKLDNGKDLNFFQAFTYQAMLIYVLTIEPH